MKQITLNIPEKKINFFIELFKQLGLEVAQTIDVPDWQKEEVLKRMERSKVNPERLLDWEQVKEALKID